MDVIEAESPAGSVVVPAGSPPKFTGIAIVGSHPATVMQAPFADPNWLIYACSPHNIEMRQLPRWDEWFEVHLPAAHPTRGYHYLRSLEEAARRKQDAGEAPTIWMRDQAAMPHFPGARSYPEAEMKDIFCPFLFTSSIAFIMAKAIADAETLGIGQIGLWGILQGSETEYRDQRPGTQYFIWEAAKRGIKVLAAKESRLFEPPAETF